MSSDVAFFKRLEGRVASIRSLLIVGLDPTNSDISKDLDELRVSNPSTSAADAAMVFCKRLIDATVDYAAGYKPNAAFFEAFGPAGGEILLQIHRYIREKSPNAIILLDSKRGDISTTAEAYASAAYDVYGADSVTVNGYMGSDSVTPFKRPGKGIFLLCKTSNTSSNQLQTLPVDHSGLRLFEVVAQHANTTWGSADEVGLVVGATDCDALSAVRKVANQAWILAPGVGAQGGDLEAALRAGLRPDGMGMLIPVSRGISKAADPATAAREFRDQINAIVASISASASVSSQAGSGAAGTGLAPYKTAFIESALSATVLRFGSFTLKSGRISPYFFNAGNFKTGKLLAQVGRCYADAVIEAGIAFDVLFGPAYKGIPLVTATAYALAEKDCDVPVAYNRKEAKDHGEGGTLVGAELSGRRVLIVDDVITAGTAINEAVSIIKSGGGIPVGVVVGLDRQERASLDVATSAVQQVEELHGIPVVSVVKLQNLVQFISVAVASGASVSGFKEAPSKLLASMTDYRSKYGVS